MRGPKQTAGASLMHVLDPVRDFAGTSKPRSPVFIAWPPSGYFIRYITLGYDPKPKRVLAILRCSPAMVVNGRQTVPNYTVHCAEI